MTRALFALFAASALGAQPRDARPAYEVASIKLNNSASGSAGTDGSTGQIMFTNLSLQRLIAQAYQIAPFQVSGPGWLESEHFDIVAKFPPGAKRADRPAMLRTLLEDRFKLATHLETREASGYALVVAKGGFKLKPVEAGDGNDTDHSGGRVQTLLAKRTTMALLAQLLSRYMAQAVVDKTGIEGAYQFELKWTNDDQSTDDSVPSIFTALQDTLGLHLQPQKVPAEIVVVDHIERTPTDN